MGASRDGWKHMPANQPRRCQGCGEHVTLKQNVFFRTGPVLETWHVACMVKP